MVTKMETMDMKLNDSEQQMFGQLFTLYDSANSGIVSQSVAKQVLNSSNLEPKILDQIIELTGSSRLSCLTRQQFYAMLKLVGAAQSGLPLSTDITNALTIPLPQLSPIVVDTNKQQLIVANNIDENSKSESINQISGHLPPPPTKPSVRYNRRNNQFSNSDNSVRQPIETHDNCKPLTNNMSNNNNSNNSSNNHNETELQIESETTNSRSSSPEEVNDDSPINSLIEKIPFDYRDKSWSEFNDKNKDKPLNWEDYEEEHHLLDEDDEDEEEHEVKSHHSEDFEDIWTLNEEQISYYSNQFKTMQPNLNGVITGNKAKDFFEKSNLPILELSRIWQLSDIDTDGALTLQEFCIAMHLVVIRRNNVDLPSRLPKSLMKSLASTAITRRHVSDLSLSKSEECLVTDCGQKLIFNAVSPPKYNDLNEQKTKNTETLSPQNKQWTKFTDSPTHQIVVTSAVTPPSTSSSAGLLPLQTLANFDFNTASIVRDPKILHPVALRLSPDGQPIRYDSNETNSHSLESTVHTVNVTDSVRPSAVIQKKKDPPPPPPPRPERHGHARSSSLDLTRVIVRSDGSGAANDLISSQIPYLKVSNSEYGLTAPQKEVPNLSINHRNVGAFQAYRKSRTETSLKNNINNSMIDALKLRYKLPAEVPTPDPSADSTQLWQTIMSFQEYTKVLTNVNNDLLRELIKANEDKHSLELKIAQLSNGCKL